MGLQDRDYFWKKQRDNEDMLTKKSVKHKPKGRGILFPLLSAGILGVSINAYSESQQKESISILKVVEPVYSASLDSKKASKIISLKADKQGHFRGSVYINHVKMPFLVDTGATRTVIPEKLARKARLPIGKTVMTNTAGGQVPSYQTRIDILKIGDVVIKDVSAQINQHIDEVLIGMNTLKYFKMEISDKTMTLVSNSDDLYYANAHADQESESIVVKKKTVIKKKVVCDEYDVCRTSYSN